MRKAVFGGSFDPPHEGHMMLARAVLGRNLAEHLVFVPAWHPPHKKQKPVASFADRLGMLRAAAGDSRLVSVSDIERRMRKNPSFTFDTMEALEAENPDDELLLLIGSDSLLDLHSWFRAADIVRKWKILSYPRPGSEVGVRELDMHWPPEIARRLADGIMPSEGLSPLASSQIRYNISACGNFDGLPDAVRDFIVVRKLYKSKKRRG
jgi:nicotinate-nucleotide adenylyltransferase